MDLKDLMVRAIPRVRLDAVAASCATPEEGALMIDVISTRIMSLRTVAGARVTGSENGMRRMMRRMMKTLAASLGVASAAGGPRITAIGGDSGEEDEVEKREKNFKEDDH